MKQRATITKSVELVYGNVEDTAGEIPEMTLADGSIEQAFFCDRFTPEGTTGWAEYDQLKGVWSFTPDFK